MALTGDLRQKRESIVREHMAAENRLDFDAALKTFDHPRYELIGSEQVFEGEQDVVRYFKLSRTPFPDQSNEIIAFHHADGAVIVEFWLMGTHKGPLGDIPPTNKKFRARMCAFFVFEGERFVCERVYFDRQTIQRQLIGEG